MQPFEKKITQAIQYHKENKTQYALSLYNEILEEDPHNADVWHLIGLLYFQDGQIENASQHISKALSYNSHSEIYHYNLACVLKDKDPKKSIFHLKKSIAINPQYISAYELITDLCLNDGTFEETEKYIQEGLKISPENAIILHNYAFLFKRKYQYDKAYEIFKKLPKNDPVILNNFSILLIEMGHYNDARSILLKLSSISEYTNIALCNLTTICVKLGQYTQANQYSCILAENNFDSFDLSYNRILIYLFFGEYYKAKLIIDKELQNNNLSERETLQLLYQYGLFAYYTCDWELAQEISNKLNTLLPHYFKKNSNDLFIPIYSSIHLRLDQSLLKEICYLHNAQSKIENLQLSQPIVKSIKIKIGYLSGDFQRHSIGILLGDLFSYHTNSFEVHALSLSHQNDIFNETIQKSVDYYHNFSALSDEEIISTIASLEIDILIDLTGYTSKGRSRVLQGKPAPVIIHWLGCMTSLHMPEVDYFVSHKLQIHEKDREDFTENILYLPECLIACNPNFSPWTIPKEQLLRTKRDNNIISFSSYNQYKRLSKDTFDMWLEILKRLPEARLIFPVCHDVIQKNFSKYLFEYGLSLDRILYNGTSLVNDDWHICQYDVSLDCTYESALTSSMLSYVAGVPVLTLQGSLPMQRSSAILANAIQKPDFIAYSHEDYINKACLLGQRSQELKGRYQDELREEILQGPLFQQKRFMHFWEEALKLAWEQRFNPQKTLEISKD